nr:hypothetical protein [Tanacetum cinerariifolium]
MMCGFIFIDLVTCSCKLKAHPLFRFASKRTLFWDLLLDSPIIGEDSQGQDATQVKKFVFDIGKTNMLKNVKLTYWEETFTSKHGELVAHPSHFEATPKKLMSDKFAPTFMLQGYLDAVNKAKKQRETYPKPF